MERPSDIDRILEWPAASWSPDETVRVAEYRRSLVDRMLGMVDLAERENRNLTIDEAETFDALEAENALLALDLQAHSRS
jgi:hypothetical protein